MYALRIISQEYQLFLAAAVRLQGNAVACGRCRLGRRGPHGDVLEQTPCTMTDEEKKRWSTFLPLFQMGQNAHFNSTLGVSSFEALTGRFIPIPISIAVSSNSNGSVSSNGTEPFHEPFHMKEVFDRLIKGIILSKNKLIQIRSSEYSN